MKAMNTMSNRRHQMMLARQGQLAHEVGTASPFPPRDTPPCRLRNVPIGIVVRIPTGKSTTLHIAPPHGFYAVERVRSFNDAFMVVIERVESNDILRAGGDAAFDAASYEGKEHDADWGTISRAYPLVLVCKPWGNPCVFPDLNWTLFGTWTPESTFQTCGPASPPGLPSAHDIEPPAEPTPDVIPKERLDRWLEDVEKAKKAPYPELPVEDRPSPHAWGIPRKR